MYVPNDLIRKEHESMIFRSTNTIILPISSQVEVDYVSYYWGLAGVPIAFVGLLIFFLIYLCFYPLFEKCCCKKRKENKRYCCNFQINKKARIFGFILFLCCCFGSIAMWSWSFAVNDKLDVATDSFQNSLTTLTDLSNTFLNTLNSVNETINSLITTINNFANDTTCRNDTQPIGNNLLKLEPEINQSQVAVDDLGQTFNDIKSVLYQTKENVDIITDYRVVILNVWSSLMLFIVASYTVIVSCAFLLKPQGKWKACLSRIERCSIFSIYAFGILLFSLAIIIGVIINAVGKGGADFCYGPSPNQVSQRFFAQYTSSTSLNTESRGEDACKPVDFSFGNDEPSALSYLACYYQSCVMSLNETEIGKTLNQVEKTLKDMENSTKQGSNITDIDKCAAYRTIVSAELTLQESLKLIFAIAACDDINKLLSDILDQSLCEGFVTAAIIGWRSYIIGSFLLLFALLLYLLFDFSKHYDYYTYHEIFKAAQQTNIQPVGTNLENESIDLQVNHDNETLAKVELAEKNVSITKNDESLVML